MMPTKEKIASFRNNAPFRSCMSTIDNTSIDNAEDIDSVMSIIIS